MNTAVEQFGALSAHLHNVPQDIRWTDGAMSAEEVARFLSVSKSWVRARIRDGVFPHTKLGGAVRLPRRVIVEALSFSEVG